VCSSLLCLEQLIAGCTKQHQHKHQHQLDKKAAEEEWSLLEQGTNKCRGIERQLIRKTR